MRTARAELEVLADPDALARRVADWMLDLATVRAGPFAVALSGGSTPRRLYELLATPPYSAAYPWSRSHWFLGDERFVPADDPLSNYKMARDALLSRVPIPAANLHPVSTQDLTPEEAAQAYERDLKTFYGSETLDPARPLFDVTLLGLGPDGHTASLFPRTAVLDERGHWVAAVIGAKVEARITLTYPALDSSAHLAFLVEGAEKQAILTGLLRGDSALPAARVQPSGVLRVFADKAAMGEAPHSM